VLILQLDRLWGTGEIIEVAAPSVADDDAIRAHIALVERRSGTPNSMAALIRMNASFDVRPSLSKI